MSDQLHVPAALLPETDPLVPTERRLDRSQSQSRHHGKEKNLARATNRTLDHPVQNLVHNNHTIS
jgi:hypothetical protein